VSSFVLVHGAWHGAWCWRALERLLRRAGHETFAPTLTGVADRSHLMSAAINLDTHIDDVVNLVKWEGLSDIVLVGHSYGGMVISGVAERIEKNIASIVYLDAFIPENGQRLADLTVAATRDLLDAAQAKGELGIRPRSAASFNIAEKNQAWIDSQCTPQPIRTFTQPVSLTGARERIAKRAYIRAAAYPNEPFDAARNGAAKRGWKTYDVPCGHDIMVDMPERLAEILVELA
jgi:pimeloyl-ACP methyl ester carboxylesterase